MLIYFCDSLFYVLFSEDHRGHFQVLVLVDADVVRVKQVQVERDERVPQIECFGGGSYFLKSYHYYIRFLIVTEIQKFVFQIELLNKSKCTSGGRNPFMFQVAMNMLKSE